MKNIIIKIQKEPKKFLVLFFILLIPIVYISLGFYGSYCQLNESKFGIIQKTGLGTQKEPMMYINDTIYYFTSDSVNYITSVKIGDSISKKSGKYDALIYRKDSNGRYKIVFKLKYNLYRMLNEH